jgi:ABC-type branched-subunit amino acid transport system ATPase component
MGQLPAKSGSIRWQGEDISRCAPHQRVAALPMCRRGGKSLAG